MLFRHIEAFELLGRQLAEAVRRDDGAAILSADRALAAQLNVVFSHKAVDRREIDQQIRFFSDLVARHADDTDSVVRFKDMLVALFRRYLPSSDGNGLPEATARPGYDASLQEMLLDSVPERIGVIGLDYRYIYTNEQNARFHQIRPAGFIGRHIVEFIGEPAFSGRVKAKLDQCFSGASLNYGYEVEDRNGQKFAVNCRMSPLRDGGGAIVGAIVMLTTHPVFAGTF